uniref:Secreted Ly6/Plaur domain containing 1 n=1 Tax=Mus musculus TaxID=10090 RepID=A0A0A0MQ72_MOUSE
MTLRWAMWLLLLAAWSMGYGRKIRMQDVVLSLVLDIWVSEDSQEVRPSDAIPVSSPRPLTHARILLSARWKTQPVRLYWRQWKQRSPSTTVPW